ncbi:MAG: hypothetical protein H0V63_05550 [Burkholderiaceae bacterium]|nr:hypothetical protein [Burkholderiaceae bacterium]
MKTGTHDVSSLFAARLSSVPDFSQQNLATVQRLLDDELAGHNRVMEEMLGELADVTTDRIRTYGSTQGGSMVETDEYGRAPTQKEAPGETLGFPLKRFQYAVGWTDVWFDIHKPIDMAVAVAGAQSAHRQRVAWDIKNALFQSANYTFTDHLVDNVVVGGTNGVKRLLNADSTTIPVSPSGTTFTGSSHTHYVGEASYTAAFLTTEIANVTEHGHTADMRVYINSAQETATRAFTGFVAYVESRVQNLTAGLVAVGRSLDVNAPIDNRAIGLFGGAEVWIKPWVPANYVFIFDAAGPKPLVFRQRDQTVLQGLRLKATNRAFPLEAEFFVAEYGISAWNRTNGSVLYIANATYADYAAAAP